MKMTSQGYNLNESDNAIENNIAGILEDIKNSTDDIYVITCMQTILSNLNQIPISKWDDSVFKILLPYVKKVYTTTLDGIKERTSNASITQSNLVEELPNLLTVSVELLNIVDGLILFLLDHYHIQLRFIKSVPEIVGFMLHLGYAHCQESENIYGHFFHDISSNLNQLFKKCYEVQCNLLTLLYERVEFKCELEEDFNVLENFLNFLCGIGKITYNLDVKIMTDTWKYYTKLCEKYVDYLKQHHNVFWAISFISGKICDSLEHCVSETEFIKTGKNIKISGFLLKIVIKLCEIFCGYLGDDGEPLVSLLIYLYRFSAPYLELKKVPPEIINEITKHLSIGGEPLLGLIVNDNSFIAAFCKLTAELNTKPDDQHLGVLLLSCALLKKLINSTLEIKNQWMLNRNNIVAVVFNSFKHSHIELCADLQIPSVMHSGLPRRCTDLYELVLTHVSSFIVSCTSAQYLLVEEILFENLLQSSLWSALLAIDVWVIIARFLPSEISLQHLRCLSSIITNNTTPRPEFVFVVELASRLVPLLTRSHRATFESEIISKKHPALWRLVGDVTPEMLSPWPSFDSTLEPNGFISLEQNVDLMCTKDLVGLEELLSPLVQTNVGLWRCLPLNSPQHNYFLTKRWTHRHLTLTTKLTEVLIPLLCPKALSEILYHILNITRSKTTYHKLLVLKILRKLGTLNIVESSEQTFIFKLLSESFYELLTSKNELIKQEAFDTFSYFAHTTTHTDVVGMSLNGDNCLQEELTQFLQRQNIECTVEKFCERQLSVRYTHRCGTKSDLTEVDIVSDVSAKKFKPSFDCEIVNDAIQKLNESVEKLSINVGDLTENNKRDIKELCNRLNRLI